MLNDLQSITAALAAPFAAQEIKWKPQSVKGNRALALAYLDSRKVQDRLDEVLGVENWQDEYEILADGSVMCKLRCKIGESWITKMDVGSPSEQPDGGDRMKAAFSDALKRAAVKFGIGRYLYRLPAQWTDYDPVKRTFLRIPQLPSFAQKPNIPSTTGTKTGSLPQNGAELLQRIDQYEAKLVARSLCQPGQLLAFVREVGANAGHGDDLCKWPAEAIQLASRAVKQFEQTCHHQQHEAVLAKTA